MKRAAALPDVYVVSPSGAVNDADRVPVTGRLAVATANLARAGFAVRLDRAALSRHQRFAGTDVARAAAFERAAAQAAPIVMTTRGGYGLSRLLDRLDFERLAASGKRWVGFSDFTAFHLAMLARARAVTWAGPALLDFGHAALDPDEDVSLASFAETMRGQTEAIGFTCRGAPAGLDVRGTLWGGNLAMVCSLLGTPYFPAVRGGILFLEETNEHPYRVERSLAQLLHAGVLERQKAVLIGRVDRYRLFENDRGYDLRAALAWVRSRTATPIIEGLPHGHEAPSVTLPHGARVGLAAQGRTAYLLLPHAH